MIRHREGKFWGVGRVRLYYQSWHPTKAPRAILILIHGLGSYSDIFSNLVAKFVALDYALYGLDLRGHGRSSGQRGYINSWDEFREDLQAFLQLVRSSQNNIPIFAVGHSLGSLIILDYILHQPEIFSGAIALAPPLGKVGVSPFKLTLGKILARVCPRFFLNTGIDPSLYSRDEKLIQAYREDPLIHQLATARFTTEFLKTQQEIIKHKDLLKIPLLILHGSGDMVTLPEASRQFIEKVNFSNVQFKEYPQAYHDIQNDPDRELIFKDISDWLEQRLSQIN